MTMISRQFAVRRWFDAIAAALLLIAGVGLLIGFHRPQSITVTLLLVGSYIWASLIALGSAGALAGALLRTDHPGRRRFIGFGAEMIGWALVGIMIFVYAFVSMFTGGNIAGVAALYALTTFLGREYTLRWMRFREAKS